MLKYWFLWMVCISALTVEADLRVSAGTLELGAPQARLRIGRADGAVVISSDADSSAVWRVSGAGLWSAEMNGGRLEAAQFKAGDSSYAFSFSQTGAGSIDLIYRCATLKVVVHLNEAADGFDLSASVFPIDDRLRAFELPAKISFDLSAVERLIMPAMPNHSVGLALKRSFFTQQPEDSPGRWRVCSVGPAAFIELFGSGIALPDDKQHGVALKVTDEGARWFDARLTGKINALKLPSVRAQPEKLSDITLVTSSRGAYFAGSRLGGEGGCLWRIGDGIRDEEHSVIARQIVSSTVRRVIRLSDGQPRRRIALIDLNDGPETGGWSTIKVAEWRGVLQRALTAAKSGQTVESLRTINAIDAALQNTEYLCIVNPYGEYFPARDKDSLLISIGRLRNFVQAGGNWFETGGYPFYQMLVPERYLSYAADYPPAYADMLHLESNSTTLSLYRAQPRTAETPWQSGKDHDRIFVPAHLFCGGDQQGGYLGRSFLTWIESGSKWTTPQLRLRVGLTMNSMVSDYCAANSITTALHAKIDGERLANLRQAPLLYLSGTCADKLRALKYLPVPSLIHFADYLHGGFDKQYPDHLPPAGAFGSMDEFKALVRELHARGHLFSPYTNPTWWCDQPRGPTFEREGEAPLLVQENGKKRYEKYGDNPGWTTTLWHPAVQAVNRAVRDQFRRELSVDILFQDQCGARGFLYDFNSASPTPYAYSEGMIAMNAEDSALVALGTEHGWDRIAEYQTLLCGLTWGIVPTRGGPTWRRSFKRVLPPRTWEIYPLAQHISHDKCVFAHHDLGQFVTDNRSLSWSLALGYHLSWRGSSDFTQHPPSRNWYAWLSRLQKTVAARYTGRPLRAFNHDRAPLFVRDTDYTAFDDDGVITATYGSLAVRANLGPVTRVVDGRHLAPYGFYAEDENMRAGILAQRGGDECSFVLEYGQSGGELWLYAEPGRRVEVPLPFEESCKIRFDGLSEKQIEVDGCMAAIDLPAGRQHSQRSGPVLWHATIER